ncbi:chaplin [Streptomyces sp. NPDC102467]|uniref:chaplin n=1 Tax=Streptomyces sp. NPDC102467 TaxID=3366179 RepID=UPI0038284966
MKQALRIGAVAAAAATGILSMTGGSAIAGTGSTGQSGGSPGVLSGNSVAAPVAVPVNLCGNSVDAVGVGNPAFGNTCKNDGHSHAVASSVSHPRAGGYGDDTTEHAPARARTRAPHTDTPAATATGSSTQSGGVLAGNSVQAPVNVGLNLCGDTVDVVGALNPAMGNSCANGGHTTTTPGSSEDEVPPAPHEGHEGHEGPSSPPADRALPGAHDAGEVDAVSRRAVPMTGATAVLRAPVAQERLADTGVDQNVLGAAAAGAGLLVGGGILYRRARTARR